MKEINFDDIKQLYHSDWYDGPIIGMGELDGQRVWYELSDEDYADRRRIRKYKIYKPSEQQIKENDHWHSEFMRIAYGGTIFENSRNLTLQKGWESFYGPFEKAKETFQPFTDDQLVVIAVEKSEPYLED